MAPRVGGTALPVWFQHRQVLALKKLAADYGLSTAGLIRRTALHALDHMPATLDRTLRAEAAGGDKARAPRAP